MHRFITLARVLLMSSYGLSSFKARAKKNKLEYLKALGIGAAITAGVAPAVALYSKLLIQGFDLLAPYGMQGAILTLGIVLVSVMIFYFGIFYIITIFYFAEDTQILLALPLRPWQVLGAKFSVVLLYEYLTAIPFLLPPLLIFGIKSGAAVIFWLYAIIGFLFVPLLPLALASLLIILVMRFTNLARRKDLFKILGGITAILLAIGVQFLFQKSGPNTMDPLFIQNLLTNPDGLVNVISRIFPSTRLLALALVHSSTISALFNLLYFTGLSLLLVVITGLAGEKLYFQGLIGSGETVVKRKTASDYGKLVKVSPAMYSYLKKEIRLLIRTPAYFMNCVLATFLIPVFMALPFILQSRHAKETLPWESLAHDPKFPVIIMVIISGIALFLTIANSITATSISREGKQFYISKYIPLSYGKQIQAKLLSGFLFGIIGTMFVLAATGILIKLNPGLAGIIAAVTLVAIVPVLEIGLLIDLYRPKLDWDNEQKAVKQNLNSILAMLLSLLIAGGMSFIVIKYLETMLTAVLFMLLGYGLLAIILYYVLMSRGVARYKQLEN